MQNTALRFIAAHPGISSAELARRMHRTPQTMHKIVATLEHRELVRLQPRPGHGRVLGVEPTAPGRKLMDEADVVARAIEERMVAGLDEHQRQQLADLLQHCVTALGDPPGS